MVSIVCLNPALFEIAESSTVQGYEISGVKSRKDWENFWQSPENKKTFDKLLEDENLLTLFMFHPDTESYLRELVQNDLILTYKKVKLTAFYYEYSRNCAVCTAPAKSSHFVSQALSFRWRRHGK